MTSEKTDHADSASVSTDGLERAAFEAWSGSAPVEFENSSGDRLAFWCWQAWQEATKAEREACALTVRELDLCGEEMRAADAIRARSNVKVRGDGPAPPARRPSGEAAPRP